ncbi:MAG: MmgE/PrpD family protein [Alphaproteobacteria bacterium]|jgi:2-methylcitrate dehydratase PrpD|nr:MmgE/PrpD family protein [Alphaproteobacteria bacterium]
MVVDSETVSQALAGFVAASRWEDMPERVKHEAKRSLLNCFATAFAGCRDDAVEISLASFGSFGAAGQASLIGRSERVDPLTAAFLNAAAANVHDFDDTHLRTVIHPAAPVAPALLALSEKRLVSGPALIQALALGIEVTCRIGNAISPGHYARGWHITSTCGVFGAALAAGKVLGLDARRLVWALGNASAQASGLVETLGFMAKSVGVGGAARGGLLAADLAARGHDGPAAPLEGTRGFLNVTGEAPALDEITEGLGTRWEVLSNIHKPYPCGIVLNAVIDACLELRGKGLAPIKAVDTITLHGHPLLRQRADRPDVATGRESQVSAQHAVAITLLRGKPGLAAFTDAAVNDPATLALRETVRLVDDPDGAVPGVRVVVALKDGSEHELIIDHARGTDERPLTDGELEEKFRALVAEKSPACGEADKLIDAIWNLDGREDASTLLHFARPTTP